jgi:glycosyltransferase involved in cell wall biosynthesis
MTRFGIGGTEKQVVNLSKRLDSTIFDLRFASLRRCGSLVNDIESAGFSIDEYPITHLYGYTTLRRQWQFARALRREQIEIMHSYNFYSNVFSVPAARIARVPCVIASVRDLGVYMSPAQCRVQKWACSMADIVLVNAKAIRDWMLKQGIPEQKLRVIYNGVDVEKLHEPQAGEQFRRELQIPSEAPIVTMLARLDTNKGTDCFLGAAPDILKRRSDAHFVVVGDVFEYERGVEAKLDTTEVPTLVKQAKTLGISDRVHFTGERTDIPAILSATTISVLPSESEGLSNTLLESMSAGAAVVATKVGGTPELIRDGREGLLVPPRDSQAITEAVGLLLDNPGLTEQLRKEAKRRVEKSFSFDEMTRRTEALYLELMEAKRILRFRHGVSA